MTMRNGSNPGIRVRSIFARLLAPVLTLAVCALPQVAHAAAIYVANANGFGGGAPGTVGQYTTAGVAVNASLITGNTPQYLAVLGSSLYVADFGGQVGQYTTSGAVVNASLVTGLNGPLAIAVVPEPASLALIGVMGAMMLRRRSKMSSAV